MCRLHVVARFQSHEDAILECIDMSRRAVWENIQAKVMLH